MLSMHPCLHLGHTFQLSRVLDRSCPLRRNAQWGTSLHTRSVAHQGTSTTLSYPRRAPADPHRRRSSTLRRTGWFPRWDVHRHSSSPLCTACTGRESTNPPGRCRSHEGRLPSQHLQMDLKKNDLCPVSFINTCCRNVGVMGLNPNRVKVCRNTHLCNKVFSFIILF